MSASSWPDVAVPAADAPAVVAASVPRWTLATRIAFRFLFVYLGIYNIEFVLQLLPMDLAMKIAERHAELWRVIVAPVALQLFGVKAEILPNGSGDTTFNYVQVFVIASAAAIATLVWSVADRRRASYPALYAWFRTYVRFALATAMIAYGVVKVVKLQFGPLLLERLTQPIGDASPMGLLWTFMSFSAAYTFFAGAGELFAGLLLTMRRTALFGALIAAGVMLNVAVLNFSYDVPVKIYSTHLLLMALFVAAPDLSRLTNFLILNRATEPAELRPSFADKRVDMASRVLRTALVAFMVGYPLKTSIDTYREWNANPNEKAPLFGIWNVDQLRIAGADRPPLTTDGPRWRRLIVSGKRTAAVDLMNETRTRYAVTVDEQKRTLLLKKGGKPFATFAFVQPDPATLVLNGTLDGQAAEATLRRVPKTFQLTSRGFHWINEFPFNR